MINMSATVVIPSKNRLAKTIEACKSAADIPLINEIIVCDDGSNFPIELYLNELPDILLKKIKIMPNRFLCGAQGARLTAVHASSNDIIVFLDSDDILNKNGVMSLLSVIMKDSKLSLVYGNNKFGGESSNWLRLEGERFCNVLKNLSLCPFSGLVVRKSLIDWGGVNADFPAWQDDDMCLVASKCGKIAFVDTISAENFLSDDSISRSKYKQLLGLSMLIEKYKAEILENFGLVRLLLWRGRQVALFLEVLSEDVLRSTRSSNKFTILFFGGVSKILKITSRVVKLLLRPFFDRIYC